MCIEEIWYSGPVQNCLRILQQPAHSAIFIRPEADAKLRAYLACVLDDALTEGLTLGVVSGKPAVNVVVAGKRMGKRLRFRAGFGDAKPQVRTRRGGRIADQDHATEDNTPDDP
jgi:hypothetical protein